MKRWFSGVPCGNGHTAPRYASSNSCIECDASAKAKFRSKDPQATKDKAREYSRTFRQRNPGYHAQYQVGFRERNGDRIAVMKEVWPSCQPEALQAAYQARKQKMIAADRQRRYGISQTQYGALVEAQKGRCAICPATSPGDRFESWLVDHDHNTGKVRGLLCSSCNKGLGQFRDSVENLRAAERYLTAPPAYGLLQPSIEGDPSV